MAVSKEVRAKRAHLEKILAGYGSVLVAYSGGVDSTFLAYVAGQVLKNKALAVTASSESLAQEDLAEAGAVAARFEFQHEILRTAELENEKYAANPRNRCYFCKAELMQKLSALAKARGLAQIAFGANMDDLADDRPGEVAACEAGAVFPLREAQFSKSEIRELSRELGLPTWDKPGAACLASRIPFGERITAEKLNQVARGEFYLHQAGFRECRLRHHGSVARLEVPAGQMPALLQKRAEIIGALKKLGFCYITLDLQGFRSGSMHEALKRGK
jgi:uncharacterized protein